MNAQGEDVVAGIRTPQQITQSAPPAVGHKPTGVVEAEHERRKSLEELMPDLPIGSSDQDRYKLEKHYRDMQDLEFTIERWTTVDAADPQR